MDLSISDTLTIEDFVSALWKELSKSKALGFDNSRDLLHYAHVKGWIEDQDESESTNLLNKRTAARILHQFMKIELNIPDEEDINRASILKDLYTCRTCANHIAQIYVKEILQGEEIENNGEIVIIFNSLRLMSQAEILEALNKIKKII